MKRARRFRPRWLGLLLLVAVSPFLAPAAPTRVPLGLFADAPTPVVARIAPAPDAAATPDPSEPPGALDGFVAVFSERDRFVVRAEPELAAHAERLARIVDVAFDDLQRLLGPAPGPLVEIRLVSNAGELARVAPPRSPPPRWASGITYADRNLILLALVSPRTGHFIPLPAVARHELAHLVVDRVVRGHPLPRWLDEGLALWAAGDDYAGRSEALLDAALRDDLIPLERLESGYPADPAQVPLAYAQSLDVVVWLADTYGKASLRALLRTVGEGRPFRQAVLDTFGTTVVRLEEDWRQGIRVWYRWIPALVSGTTLWGLISVLLAWAYLRQRRVRKQLYDEWDREEETAERQAAAAVRWPDEDPKPYGGIRTGAQAARKARGPIVYHDGRYHTLH